MLDWLILGTGVGCIVCCGTLFLIVFLIVIALTGRRKPDIDESSVAGWLSGL